MSERKTYAIMNSFSAQSHSLVVAQTAAVEYNYVQFMARRAPTNYKIFRCTLEILIT
jgi:hypothetical protein